MDKELLIYRDEDGVLHIKEQIADPLERAERMMRQHFTQF